MNDSDEEFERFRTRVRGKLFQGLPDQARRLGWNAAQITAHQLAGLRALLARALECSPFHARRLAGIRPDRFEMADLRRLPVMTKAEMMEELDDVFTDRRLSRNRVEDVLARTTDRPIPMFDAYVAQASGGSSGRRGVFVHDEQAHVEFASSILRPTLAGGAISRAVGSTMAFVAADSAVHGTGIPAKMLEGSPLRIVAAPASLPMPELVDRLNRIRPDALFGYPSALVRLAAEQHAGRLRISPSVVRSSSETLLPELRRAIRSAFAAPIVDTFASSEGLVGVSEPDDETLVFASDQAIVELVDDRNEPVRSGDPAARVLVTMLQSRAQPLVRYVLEDVFVERPPSPAHGHLRATVHGRADDVLRFGNVVIHPIVVRAVLVKAPEILDYQVRQTEHGIDVAVVTERPIDPAAVGSRLCAALERAGLVGPRVRTEIVSTLERIGGTGKLRRFIPLG